MNDDWIWIIVPVVAIIAWGAMMVTRNFRREGADPALQRALEENAAANKALLAKLETIDSRLGAVEKTLNDIP